MKSRVGSTSGIVPGTEVWILDSLRAFIMILKQTGWTWVYPNRKLTSRDAPPLINCRDGTDFKCFPVILADLLPKLICRSCYSMNKLHLEMNMPRKAASPHGACRKSYFSPHWPSILTTFPGTQGSPGGVSCLMANQAGGSGGGSGYHGLAVGAEPWARLVPLCILRVWGLEWVLK